MAKQYNIQFFDADVNGQRVSFKAYTTSTRSGFCHTIVNLYYDVTDTKVSYWNRTWERFDYETALIKAIAKMPKSMQGELTEQIIERKAKEEHEKADAFVNAFTNLYKGISEESKEKLKDTELTNIDDAKGLMLCMALENLAQ